MKSFNKVMLLGRLTSDPETKTTKQGGQMTTFAIAINRNWKSREGDIVSETEFHQVVSFGKLAEITGKYLKKGKPVLVSGRLSNRAYTDKDGKRRYFTEVVMDDFHFMDFAGKKGGQAERQGVEIEIERVDANSGELLAEEKEVLERA